MRPCLEAWEVWTEFQSVAAPLESLDQLMGANVPGLTVLRHRQLQVAASAQEAATNPTQAAAMQAVVATMSAAAVAEQKATAAMARLPKALCRAPPHIQS